MALLWYWSCRVFLYSGKNGLDGISWRWLLILALGPILSAILAFALHLELRRTERTMKVYEIALVVFVVPQFIGVVFVWWGLLHYM